MPLIQRILFSDKTKNEMENKEIEKLLKEIVAELKIISEKIDNLDKAVNSDFIPKKLGTILNLLSGQKQG